MPSTLMGIPTLVLVVAAGVLAALAITLGAGILVRLKLRKKRAARRSARAVAAQALAKEPEAAPQPEESRPPEVAAHPPPLNGYAPSTAEHAAVEPAHEGQGKAEALESVEVPEARSADRETLETRPAQRGTPGTRPAADHAAEETSADRLTAKPSAPPKPRPAPKRVPFALRRTRERFLSRLRAVLAGGQQLEEICAGLEEALIEADGGVETSVKLIDAIRPRLKRSASPEAVRQALKDEMALLLRAVPEPAAGPQQPPLVVVLVGVNGVGKTTTVAKLAAYFKAERGSVIVGAADTFRAAAVEQLEVWCQRAGVDLIKHRAGSDPAAVAFDTAKAALARRAAVALIDTAGRLQTKANLMEELKKIVRVIGREIPQAPHETWLVLDATTGQNALTQAKLFSEAVPLTGVVLAKLDSSAKGGVVLAIADRLGLGVRFVGVGEELDDLRTFDREEFVEGMFEPEQKNEQIVITAYSA